MPSFGGRLSVRMAVARRRKNARTERCRNQFPEKLPADKGTLTLILHESINSIARSGTHNYKIMTKNKDLGIIETHKNRSIIVTDSIVDSIVDKFINRAAFGKAKYNNDFDNKDFEELCCEFGFNANEVVGSHAFEEPKFSKYQVEIGQFQLKLLF